MSLKSLVELYRIAKCPELKNNQFISLLECNSQIIKLLNSIASPYEITEIIRNEVDIDVDELQSDNSSIQVTIRVGLGKEVKHYKCFDDLVKHSNLIKEGVIPSEFYLFKENIYYPEDTLKKLDKLKQVCELIAALTKLANYHDTKGSDNIYKLVFIDGRDIDLSPVIFQVSPSADLLNVQLDNIAVITSLVTASTQADIHHSEKLSIFSVSLTEFINKSLIPIDAFNYFFVNLNGFIELFQKNLTTYSSGFAFHKAKKEIADMEIKFAAQLSNIMSDITGKLFSIPISLVGAITLIPKTNNLWSDLIIAIGLLLASVLVIGSVDNQRNRFKVIEKSENLVLGGFEGNENTYPQDLSQSITDIKKIVSRNITETKCWLFGFKVLAWLPAMLGATIIYLKYW